MLTWWADLHNYLQTAGIKHSLASYAKLIETTEGSKIPLHKLIPVCLLLQMADYPRTAISDSPTRHI